MKSSFNLEENKSKYYNLVHHKHLRYISLVYIQTPAQNINYHPTVCCDAFNVVQSHTYPHHATYLVGIQSTQNIGRKCHILLHPITEENTSFFEFSKVPQMLRANYLIRDPWTLAENSVKAVARNLFDHKISAPFSFFFMLRFLPHFTIRSQRRLLTPDK